MKVVPGTLVDFFSDGLVVAGMVLSEEKGRLRVATENAREDRIAPARVLAAYEGNPRFALAPGSTDTAKIQGAQRLAAAHAAASRDLLGRADLALVWEIVVDEGGERTVEDMAELAMADRSATARGAVLRALLEDKVHFTRRADLWEPRSREVVEDIRRQKDAERRRAEERERFVIKARRALAAPPAQVPFVASEDASESRFLAALQDLAVHGVSAEDPRTAQALLDELGIRAESPHEGAFRVLSALGLFSANENIFIRKYGLQIAFPDGTNELTERAIEEALDGGGSSGEAAGPDAARASAAARPGAAAGSGSGKIAPGLRAEIDAGHRRDLTALEPLSVDDELTSEIDDVLTIEILPGARARLGVHIADPGFFIPAGSALDRIVEARAVTYYLPDHRVLMLPVPLAEGAASLIPEGPRPALSFIAVVDERGTILEWEITPSVIRSAGRLSYEQADAAVRAAGEGVPLVAPKAAESLRALHRIALALEQGRLAAGAHIIRAPEVDLRVAQDGSIVLKRMEADDPGRVLVSEMMILASRLAALFCLERGVPCIYRRQPPAEEAFPSVTSGPYDPVAVRKARRGLRRSESGLTPGRHYALGLDAYAQATSPIRRYQDLVIHRQIKSVLRGAAPCYDAEALMRIAALTDEAERIARLAERGSDEYWTLRYLETQKGKTVEGVIVFIDRRRVDVELSETLHTVSIAPRPDHALGQRVTLRIEAVNPRVPSLTLRQA